MIENEYAEDTRKRVIAFTDTNGGCVYVGIDNHGTPIGVKDTDDCQLIISSSLGAAVRSDVTVLIDMKVVDVDGKNVVRIDVQRSTAKPYSLT